MSPPKRQASTLGLLVIGSVLFWIFFYFTMQASLTWSEGVASFSRVPITLGLSILYLTVEWTLVRRLLRFRSTRAVPWTDGLLFVSLSTILPTLLIRLPPTIEQGTRSSISFLWLPIEWHKYPLNIGLIAGLNAKAAALLGLGLLAVLAVLVLRDARKGCALACAIFAVLLISRLGHKDMGFRAPFFQLVLAGPWVLLALSAWIGRPRAFARLCVPAWSQGILCLFYTGVLPREGSSNPPPPIGVEYFYPRPGRGADFPLQYVRDIYVDSADHSLFASYGPTSGLIKMDLSSGRVQILPTAGLIRGLWSEPGDPNLYAIEWIYDDLWIVNKKDFRVVTRKRLMDGVLVAPIDIVLNESRIFIVSTEYPAVTSLDRTTLEKTGQVDFRREGLTHFSSGAWVSAYDASTRSLFVEIGMTDLSDQFQLVKLSADPLHVVGTARLPFGGLQMVAVPEHRSLLIPDFYSNRIAEIDMDSLHVRRTFESVVNSRSLAYDAAKDTLLSASFMTGEFDVLRYSTGEILSRFSIGKKPSQIFLPPGTREGFLASKRGLMKLSLDSLGVQP